MPLVDQEIITAAQAGDKQAFAQIIREHHPRVILLCRSMLQNNAAADDAAQEVFIKVYNRLRSFDGRSELATWLHRIAANHCIDALRKLAREKTQSLGEVEITDKGQGAAAVDAKYEVEDLLKDLPEAQRTAIILREIQGFSYEEIAQTLDCSLDSVKARLRRAREEMAKKMRHFAGSEDV
jgi:RNA polymerase sigma-70 factor (ECF subfamily)